MYARLPGLRGRRIGLTLGGRSIDFVDWGYYPPSRWRNYSHSHSYFEVCFAYAGEGTFRWQESEFDVSVGSAFVARPGDLHEIDASTSDPLGIAFWSLTVGPGWRERDWLDGFTERAAAPVTTRVDGIATVLDLLAGSLSPGGGGRERTTVLARTLAVETVHAFADPSSAPVEEDPPGTDSAELAVATMHRYLRDNLSRPLQVRDVASQVHLSERHAARIFHAATGESLLAHLRRLRMERAADRLLVESVTVTSLAAEAGFYDRRHFSRSFRDYFGVTPTQYRDAAGTTQTEESMIDGPQPLRRSLDQGSR
jgi:AraC-like DNA-binding protein